MSEQVADAVVLKAVRAQAELHHAYLLGLQLMVANHHDSDAIEEWMFRLFRQQHLDKFLSSFDKLGLSGLPDAVACAQYHVLSNSIGGVPVEYMEESERKAWVRFRYPRWMYAGPTVCGVPVGVSRGFLRGWYAHNGVSLGNPRLGFVCVSEDMTGEYGFCGYFREFDQKLADDERLQFARDELPPRFETVRPLSPPAEEWNEERLCKANRNYAVEYIRNALVKLCEVIGVEATSEIGQRAARLIGLQYYQQTAAAISAVDGSVADAAWYLATMLRGLGDTAVIQESSGVDEARVTQSALRIVRGMEGNDRDLLLSCWTELWVGAVRSHRQLMDAEWRLQGGNGIEWRLYRRN